MADEKPQQFGPYQLISRLGKGGMGETWRALRETHSGVTKELAIKRILRDQSAHERFRTNFVNEARLSARLSHGNVAQLFDFGEIDGELYMAMEYVHGRPLSNVLERAEEMGLKVLPIPVAVFIAIEILKGLTHAHGRTDEKGRPLDIVHRDISPDNVMVSFEGEVKVLDFGIARARLEGRQDTLPGVVKGKLMYLSPEQAMGRPLDGRSDVWATGLVLYRMLSGKLAADHIDAARVIYELAHGKFTPLSELAPWVPTVLGDAVAKSLKVDLEQRYASARAFSQELSVFLHRAAPATSESTLMGMMGTLYSRELYDEGREPTILPEVTALIDEARKMVESKPGARTVPRGSPVVTLKPETKNERLAAEVPETITSRSGQHVTDDDDGGPETLKPGDESSDALAHGPVPESARTDSDRRTAAEDAPRQLATNELKTDAQRPSSIARAAPPPPRSGLPGWFLPVSALVALVAVAAVVVAQRASQQSVGDAPVVEAIAPSGMRPGEVPQWKKAAEQELRDERERQAAIEARANDPEVQKTLIELDAQLKQLAVNERQLHELRLAANQDLGAGAASRRKIAELEQQNEAMKSEISAINRRLGARPATRTVESDARSTRDAKLGYLTLSTINPARSKVFLDGQALGETPMIKVPLEANAHRLQLTDVDDKLRDLSVILKSGETAEFKGINVGSLPLSK